MLSGNPVSLQLPLPPAARLALGRQLAFKGRSMEDVPVCPVICAPRRRRACGDGTTHSAALTVGIARDLLAGRRERDLSCFLGAYHTQRQAHHVSLTCATKLAKVRSKYRH